MNRLSARDIVRLIPVNQLLYTRKAPSNPIVERSQKYSYAQGGKSTVYTPGDQVIIDLQTGTEFIDPLQSFLMFDVQITGVDAVSGYFAGSALDLFSASQIATRSGVEIDRTEELNLLNYHRVKSMDPEYIKSNLNGLFLASPPGVRGQALSTFVPGGNQAAYDSLARPKVAATYADTGRICIPLKYLAGCFDSRKMMPPHMARGLRIELTCASMAEAFVQFTGAAAGLTYSLTNVRVLSDAYRMSDDVLEYLNSAFASRETGLVYEYSSFHTTRQNLGAAANADVEVRRSVSMALDAFAVVRDTDDAKADRDSFASTPMPAGSTSQWRIGSHYLPSIPIAGPVEHYAQSVYLYNKLRREQTQGPTYLEFLGAQVPTTATNMNYGMSIYPAVLSRNAVIELSGLAINNSMTLSAQITGLAGVDKNVVIFLRHLRRLVCFLESSVVET